MNEIARLQEIIAEQADQIRKGVGESRAELAEAKVEWDALEKSYATAIDACSKTEEQLAAERKRREEAERKLSETAQGKFVEGYAKAEAERDALRAEVRAVMDRMQKKAAQQGESRDDDPTFGQNFDDAYDAGRTAGEVSVAKEVTTHLTLAMGDST